MNNLTIIPKAGNAVDIAITDTDIYSARTVEIGGQNYLAITAGNRILRLGLGTREPSVDTRSLYISLGD